VQSRFFLYGLVGDNWNFNASNPVVYVGGNYNQNGNHGMFYVNYTSLTNTNANHGSRFLLDRFCEHYFLHAAQGTRRADTRREYVGHHEQAAETSFCIHSTDSRAPHWRRSATRERLSTSRPIRRGVGKTVQLKGGKQSL